VALTGASFDEPVVKVYVVKGTMSGWKISVAKVTRGGRSGYVGGNLILKRSIAEA
jgi:hypothetical protein